MLIYITLATDSGSKETTPQGSVSVAPMFSQFIQESNVD